MDSFKSRLFTNLTHEFRTPLTVILGMAERLTEADGRLTEQAAKKGLGLITRNGQNLLRLVNQLLDLSKLEDSTFKLRLQRGNIVPYLRYVTESFHTYANSRNLSQRFFTTIEALEMDFDPEQIQQVMSNLLSNALKFTPSGGEIQVRLTIDDLFPQKSGEAPSTPIVNRQSSIVIQVKDTGIGIPEAELPNIFDRFYQVDGSTTRAGEGTGIGLAHTLELVKLMGGEISVESKLGTGSTFTVKLPVRQNHTAGVLPLPAFDEALHLGRPKQQFEGLRPAKPRDEEAQKPPILNRAARNCWSWKTTPMWWTI
ncbi:MAG: HAMP domain-containing histidine kinase [Saprospiraceae bacterium]|nr:HAMP domain-containing histidine kinase [Saprospiraceae bacterium]